MALAIDSKDRHWSMVTPRYLTKVLDSIEEPLQVMSSDG